jgi:hypothetical protein
VGGVGELLVILTGELVTLGGGARHVLPIGQGTTVGDVLAALALSVHRGFGAMARAGGVFPGLGPVTVLLDGHAVDLRADLARPVGGGTMYLIPPIAGG